MIDIDDIARRAVASPIAEPPHMDAVTRLATRQRRRRRLLRTSLAFALVGVLGIGAFAGVSARDGQSHLDVHAPTNPLGLFYPAVARDDRSVIVLPSGHVVLLSGGVAKAIGGLGGAFWGHVQPTDDHCCGVRFNLYRGAPGDLFDTLAPDPISTPTLVHPEQAKIEELRWRRVDDEPVQARYVVLSAGDWTLVATFSDEDNPSTSDGSLLQRLDGWRLRPTQNGAWVELPAGSKFSSSAGIFGTYTGRQVTLDEDCTWTAERKVTHVANGDPDADRAAGRWCEKQTLGVAIEGPRSYVESVVANLEVTYEPRALVAAAETTPAGYPECDTRLPKTFTVFDHGTKLAIELSRAYYCRRIGELEPPRNSGLGSSIIVVNGKVTAEYHRITYVMSVDADGNTVETAIDSPDPVPIAQLPPSLQKALAHASDRTKPS